MPVKSYVGVPGIAIDVQNIAEVIDAIDTIHTQVMDNMGDGSKNSPIFRILEQAMRDLEDLEEEK